MVVSYRVSRTILNILQHCILDRVIVMPELDSWLGIHLTYACTWEWQSSTRWTWRQCFLSVSWSVWYESPFAFEALYKLSNVWLFRSDRKLQVMGKSDSFKWEHILVSALCVGNLLAELALGAFIASAVSGECFSCFYLHYKFTFWFWLQALWLFLFLDFPSFLLYSFILICWSVRGENTCRLL